MPHKTQKPLVDEAKTTNRNQSLSLTDKRLFNDVELRLFRYTAVLLCMVALTALAGFIVWSLAWVLASFYSLVLPLSLAGILALVLFPVVEFLISRFRLPRLLAVILVLLVFFASIGGLIFLIVPTAVRQGVQLMSVLPETIANWQDNFTFYYPHLSSMIFPGVAENFSGEDAKSSLPDLSVLPVMEDTGKTIMGYLGLLAGISFVPLFLFFALLSGGLLRGQVTELLSFFHKPTQKKIMYFIDVFLGYITAFFQGQLIIAMTMGAMYSLSFMMIGLKYGVLAGLILGLLNIVPFLGTLIGLLVILPMAYLQTGGGIELLILAVLAFAFVQLVESWWLTPKIMANRSGLHPALVVMSLFFWGTVLGGITGMVLAVPLTAFFVAIWSEIKASLEHALSGRDGKAIIETVSYTKNDQDM